MLEITPFELVDLLDAGFESIEIDYLCFLRWAVQHDEISEGEPETVSAIGVASPTARDGGDPWGDARNWVGGIGR